MSILNKFKKEKKDKTPAGADLNLSGQTSAGAEKSADKKGSAAPVLKSNASLVKRVWITEKAVGSSKFRQYSFIVDKQSNKSEIKKAIELIYGVKVIAVNTVIVKGKPRRMGRSLGRTSAYKKAIATLKEGQKIDVMPT